MIELELLGAHADGSQLVFTDPEGQRFIVTIDDALRAAVRREGIRLETMPTQGAQLSPREIQQLLRAGMEPAEISSTYDVDPARVNRFHSPVRAEKNYVISQALNSPVGAEGGTPTLGDLVVDRLATRGVDAQTLSWTASRQDDDPWELHLAFVQAARQCHASWQVHSDGKIIRALDDESRWLTETTTPASTPGSVTELPSSQRNDVTGPPVTGEDVERMLDELSVARGRRQVIDDDDDAETSPALVAFPGSATTATEESSVSSAEDAAEPEAPQADDSDVLPGLDSYTPQTESTPKPTPKRRKRRSVPSWDEIVFGSKSD
ncbi:MAG: septation protein SepH [Actinomycetaceae bacterium]|nr:septation protein SepH [Actinomycetaceae bacterium]